VSLAASTFVRDVRGALTRPYRVTLPMIALVALVPLYIFIGVANIGRPNYTPAIGIDRLIPLVPAWSMSYAMFLRGFDRAAGRGSRGGVADEIDRHMWRLVALTVVMFLVEMGILSR
jgi:hypothetical protein